MEPATQLIIGEKRMEMVLKDQCALHVGRVNFKALRRKPKWKLVTRTRYNCKGTEEWKCPGCFQLKALALLILIHDVINL